MKDKNIDFKNLQQQQIPFTQFRNFLEEQYQKQQQTSQIVSNRKKNNHSHRCMPVDKMFDIDISSISSTNYIRNRLNENEQTAKFKVHTKMQSQFKNKRNNQKQLFINDESFSSVYKNCHQIAHKKNMNIRTPKIKNNSIQQNVFTLCDITQHDKNTNKQNCGKSTKDQEMKYCWKQTNNISKKYQTNEIYPNKNNNIIKMNDKKQNQLNQHIFDAIENKFLPFFKEKFNHLQSTFAQKVQSISKELIIIKQEYICCQNQLSKIKQQNIHLKMYLNDYKTLKDCSLQVSLIDNQSQQSLSPNKDQSQQLSLTNVEKLELYITQKIDEYLQKKDIHRSQTISKQQLQLIKIQLLNNQNTFQQRINIKTQQLNNELQDKLFNIINEQNIMKQNLIKMKQNMIEQIDIKMFNESIQKIDNMIIIYNENFLEIDKRIVEIEDMLIQENSSIH